MDILHFTAYKKSKLFSFRLHCTSINYIDFKFIPYHISHFNNATTKIETKALESIALSFYPQIEDKRKTDFSSCDLWNWPLVCLKRCLFKILRINNNKVHNIFKYVWACDWNRFKSRWLWLQQENSLLFIPILVFEASIH